MPWTCERCGTQSTDDKAACPSCGGGKKSWTLHADRTRTLVVPTPQLVVQRGEREEPLLASEVHLEDAVLLDTDEARALTKAAVAALHRAGKRPAPRDILFVLYGQGQESTKKVGVTVEYAQREADARTYDFQRGGWWESRFVFVRGPEPEGWAQVQFPGLELVDVHEEGEPGHAPTVEVGVARKKKELTVVPVGVDDDRPKALRVEPAATRCRDEAAIPVPLADAWLHPVAALVRAAGLLAERPDHRLLLVGHASAPGKKATNQALSEARARSLLALVEGDRDGWVKLATDHGSLADVKGYLRYLAARRGWSCDPGDDSAKNDAAAKAGVEAFQREYAARFERPLDDDGVCGVQTLGAVFDVMRHELERWLEKHGLGPAVLLRAQPQALGCGEERVDAPGLPQPATPEGRRFVDVLVLPPELSADPAALYDGATPIELVPLDDEPGDWERGRVIVATDADPDAPAEATDRFTLRAQDGSYERTLTVGADGTRDFGGLDLVFDEVPTQAALELLVASAQGAPRPLFAGLTFAEVGRASSFEQVKVLDPFELPEQALVGGDA